MDKPQVHLCGGDGQGWALDNDLQQLRTALQGIVQEVPAATAQVIHSVWWEKLLELPASLREKRQLVCHMSGEPHRYLSDRRFRHAARQVDLWVAQSSEAAVQLQAMGLPFLQIPYTIDTEIFRPVPSGYDRTQARAAWGLPADAYLIGSFQRDSEGAALSRPKLVKGPDIFAQIVQAVHQQYPIHVVLAGPRRHWLRARLTELQVPFTYLGRLTERDDYPQNSLAHGELAELYRLLDLYIVSSRSEGGPRSILEAAACGCPLISRPVGLAADVLQSECLFDFPHQAVERIGQDIEQGGLRRAADAHQQVVLQQHHAHAVCEPFGQLYQTLDQYGRPRRAAPRASNAAAPRRVMPWWGRLLRRGASSSLTVGLWHQYVKPPYGGGNQFMLALRKGLQQRGVRVLDNRIDDRIDAYVLNSIHFDIARFQRLAQQRQVPIVHRIDGPIHLIRGFDREKDELCYRLNAELASATILQSTWTMRRIYQFGYQPVDPVIIHNGVDPDLFHAAGRTTELGQRKIRLISSSWSDNPRKGGPLYKWLDQHLDWDRFEYTFVGRASESFENIRQIAPVPSRQLGELLRQHDIYITASQCDPCSNALIEALACGLPALYLNDGGHPELVKAGGLPFHGNDDVLQQLDQLVAHHGMYQQLITVPRYDEVVERYLQLLIDVSARHRTRAA